MNFSNNRSIVEFTAAANYVKLIAAINRLKEMKPPITVPKLILYNSAYHT